MQHETLVIAPHHPDLGTVPDESATIAASMNGRLLAGEISARDIEAHIDGRKYLRIWVCSHANERGILLSEGEVLTADQLAWICNSVGAKELVINTCSSGIFVTNIQIATSSDIMFCMANVADGEATTLASAIANNYTQTGDLHASYRAVTGGTGIYKYLQNAKRRATAVNGSNQELTNGQLSRQVMKNQVDIEAADRRMSGIERQISGLGQKIDALADELRISKYMTVVNQPAATMATNDYKILIAAFIIGGFVFAGLYLGGA